MIHYVVGNKIKNAATYELLEKVGEEYVSLAENPDCNFSLQALNLPVGDHVLVVRAKGNGYTDSDYSNEITYSVTEGV